MLKLIRIVGLLAIAGLVAACSNEPTPVSPTATVSPSPSPIPSTDPSSCAQAALTVFGVNGAGNADSVFDYREPIEVRAIPVNAAGVPLAQVQRPTGDRCTFPTKAGWESGGPCQPFGSLDGLTATFYCFDSGELTVSVTHGNFVGRARLKLIR